MSTTRLLFRNLFFHWRGNLAVLLGVVVGTAVLTGALLVGDSLRGSLREQSLRRLGWVDQVLVTSRFFRAQVADELQKKGVADRVAPALLLQGTASTPEGERRVRGVKILGVDQRFWKGFRPDAPDTLPPGVVLTPALARELGLHPGDEIILETVSPSEIPRESPLGRKDADAAFQQITFPVGTILDASDPASAFSLEASPEAPHTAFVALPVLQEKLGPRDAKRAAFGRVNALLAGGVHGDVQQKLEAVLELADWELVLHTPASRVRSNADVKKLAEAVAQAASSHRDLLDYYEKEHPYISLESKRLILEPAMVEAAEKAAQEVRLRVAPTFVYLANSISHGGKEIPYSVVAALDPTQAPPLGPFLPPGVKALADNEIVLVDWKESPLKAKPGDEITLRYFPPEHQGETKERSATFRLAGFIPLQGPALDPDLTPEFPGITDKLTLKDWNHPLFSDIGERVRRNDERYWRDYRTTPKAYVTLKRGVELWGSRFGHYTSLRLAPREAGGDLEKLAADFGARLLHSLRSEQGGFVFDRVKEHSLEESQGGTDFGMLFLGFSFFLILAALLLVGLLFRLNLDRRASEVGLLIAAGYRRGVVRNLLLGEGGLIAVAGALLGTVVALGYAGLLLGFLRRTWPGGLDSSFLHLHWTWQSLGIGLGGAVVISVLIIAWVVRGLGKMAPYLLLRGQTTDENSPIAPGKPRWSLGLLELGLAGGVCLLIAGLWVKGHEAKAGTFFSGGGLLLMAGLAGLSYWMRRTGHTSVGGHGTPAVGRLGLRNAARYPARSLLTAGLLAAAAFLLVAVESFRRQAGSDYLDPHSGSGGFALLAESDLPLFLDLNSDKGRDEVLDRLEQNWRQPGIEAKEIRERREQTRALLSKVEVFAFRVKSGDDASCLNLYQPRRPRLLGVPATLIGEGNFHFAASNAASPEEHLNPWHLLDRLGDEVPVFGEQNTVVWMLKRNLGGTLDVPDAGGLSRTLRIDGLLSDSVFQNGLLMSEKRFLELYPGHEGYNFFLLRVPPEQMNEVKELLQLALADRGFAVTATRDRLEAYLAVENTYLSTFQALGGLGLLLGTLGLAVVLLRSVWERRGELALLRALGYRRGVLNWLVLAENGFLLLAGLGVGTLAALVSVTPSIASGEGHLPGPRLGLVLALAVSVGLLAAAGAAAATLRAALIPALRKE
jgi:ABC-type lipoprotein release transport system permease subunit